MTRHVLTSTVVVDREGLEILRDIDGILYLLGLDITGEAGSDLIDLRRRVDAHAPGDDEEARLLRHHAADAQRPGEWRPDWPRHSITALHRLSSVLFDRYLTRASNA